MLTMMMTNAANANANENASAAPLAEEEEESYSMSMCSEEDEEDEEESEDEELDDESVYVSLFAVADLIERWYASGARECFEDHLMRVEALLLRERATNVFETREAVDSPNVGGTVTADGRIRQLAERLEAEKARPRGERRSLGTIADLRAQAEAIAERIERTKHTRSAGHWAFASYDL